MLRLFSSNPTLPVLAVCEICGVAIPVQRHRDTSGNQWVNGEELLKAWFDHQLIECKPIEDEGVNDEGDVRG